MQIVKIVTHHKYPEKAAELLRARQKLINHHPVLLHDIWNQSENLYIAFLGAGAFDVKFSSLVTTAIRDFDSIMKNEPLAAYPMIFRGHIEHREKWLDDNPEEMELLRKFWENPKYLPSLDELSSLRALEENNLMECGGLTCVANMILSRISCA